MPRGVSAAIHPVQVQVGFGRQSTKSAAAPTVGSVAPTFSSSTKSADVGIEGSPEHVHECGRSNPTKPEHSMSDPGPLPEQLDRLGGEAQSVLAVLVLASLWPARFPGGWVSVGAFAVTGLLLGERTDRESLKAAIRRSLRRLATVPGIPVIQGRRTRELDSLQRRVRRDRDRRLGDPACAGLEQWLLREGPALIVPACWREFMPLCHGPIGADSRTGLVVVRRSLRQAESLLGFAACLVRQDSPEARILGRIRRVVTDGLREADRRDRPGN